MFDDLASVYMTQAARVESDDSVAIIMDRMQKAGTSIAFVYDEERMVGWSLSQISSSNSSASGFRRTYGGRGDKACPQFSLAFRFCDLHSNRTVPSRSIWSKVKNTA